MQMDGALPSSITQKPEGDGGTDGGSAVSACADALLTGVRIVASAGSNMESCGSGENSTRLFERVALGFGDARRVVGGVGAYLDSDAADFCEKSNKVS